MQINTDDTSAVVDENGQVLERRHFNIERLISPAKAFIITSLLRGAVETGTAKTLGSKGISWPVAGKTGTAQVPRKDGRGYEPGKYLSSIVALAPADLQDAAQEAREALFDPAAEAVDEPVASQEGDQ